LSLAEPFTDIHRELIERGREGDRLAQQQLYKLYSGAMYSICLRLTGKKEDAEDVLQEAFTEALMRLNTFRFESTFGAWLKRIVINRSINFLRRRKTEWVNIENLNEGKFAEEEEIDYEGIRLTVDRVKEAISKLPDGFRIIFSLYMLEGYDHQEIGDILGISESTSKTQFHRAKLRIREYFKNENNERQAGRIFER
jgi:RNA polymerase sigma factor (sigma-70 family)